MCWALFQAPRRTALCGRDKGSWVLELNSSRGDTINSKTNKIEIPYQKVIVSLILRKPNGNVVLVRERARWGAFEVKPKGRGGATP